MIMLNMKSVKSLVFDVGDGKMPVGISIQTEIYLSGRTILFLFPELSGRLDQVPHTDLHGERRYDAAAAMELAMKLTSPRHAPFSDDWTPAHRRSLPWH